MNSSGGRAVDTRRICGFSLPQLWLWDKSVGFEKNAKTVETNYLKLFRIIKTAKKTNSKRTQIEARNCVLVTRNVPKHAKLDSSRLVFYDDQAKLASGRRGHSSDK